MKYTKAGGTVGFRIIQKGHAPEGFADYDFVVKDNGIGIRKGEITRVFEKGFTGENGRKRGQKATGIGLYLCKKLCNKLGLGLELNSEKDVGTEVKIVFPKSSFISETF